MAYVVSKPFPSDIDPKRHETGGVELSVKSRLEQADQVRAVASKNPVASLVDENSTTFWETQCVRVSPGLIRDCPAIADQ